MPDPDPDAAPAITVEDENLVNCYKDLLDDGGYPLSGIRILTQIDEQGVQMMRWAYDGNPPRQDLIGTLEQVKFLLMASDLVDPELIRGFEPDTLPFDEDEEEDE